MFRGNPKEGSTDREVAVERHGRVRVATERRRQGDGTGGVAEVVLLVLEAAPDRRAPRLTLRARHLDLPLHLRDARVEPLVASLVVLSPALARARESLESLVLEAESVVDRVHPTGTGVPGPVPTPPTDPGVAPHPRNPNHDSEETGRKVEGSGGSDSSLKSPLTCGKPLSRSESVTDLVSTPAPTSQTSPFTHSRPRPPNRLGFFGPTPDPPRRGQGSRVRKGVLVYDVSAAVLDLRV